MIIKKVEKLDEEVYEKCTRKYGTIFNSLEWLSIFGDKVSVYGFYDKGGVLIGGFNIYEEKKFGFNIYRNPPFTPEIGPFFKVNAQNPVSVMDMHKRILSSMTGFIEKLPYSIITLSLNKHITDMQPFIWGKNKVSPVYTYLLNLTASIEDIWDGMSNERRKNINKGLKDGLVVKKLTNYKIIKSLVLKTFSRQRILINEFNLDKIFFEFANNKNSFAFATYRNDNIFACSFCVYDKASAYYILGGHDSENKHHGAGTMAMWEAIKYAKALGLKNFDFEGSMVPQIERYFRGFGGQLTPCYRISKAKLPIEIILKFFKRELF